MRAEFVTILMVEDNPGDVKLTKAALSRARFCCNLVVANDGEEALNYLYRRPPFDESAKRPHLILLDLNLPKIAGKDVLAQIKQDSDLKDIPVCILTGSKAEEDIVRSYKLHANCYLNKPVDVMDFMETIKSLEKFWFKIVMLPDPVTVGCYS